MIPDCIVVFSNLDESFSKKIILNQELVKKIMNYKLYQYPDTPLPIIVNSNSETKDFLLHYAFNQLVILYPKIDRWLLKDYCKAAYDKMIFEGWNRCLIATFTYQANLARKIMEKLGARLDETTLTVDFNS